MSCALFCRTQRGCPGSRRLAKPPAAPPQPRLLQQQHARTDAGAAVLTRAGTIRAPVSASLGSQTEAASTATSALHHWRSRPEANRRRCAQQQVCAACSCSTATPTRSAAPVRARVLHACVRACSPCPPQRVARKELTAMLATALEGIVDVEKFPKAVVDVSVMVLQVRRAHARAHAQASAHPCLAVPPRVCLLLLPLPPHAGGRRRACGCHLRGERGPC